MKSSKSEADIQVIEAQLPRDGAPPAIEHAPPPKSREELIEELTEVMPNGNSRKLEEC